MWPFGGRKKSASLPSSVLAPDDRWSLVEAEYDGAPVLVRLNASARKWMGHAALGIKLGIAVPLNEPNPGGMPLPEENQQLNAVEDAVVAVVDAATKGVYALVVTTGFMKEFVFYVGTEIDIEGVGRALQQRVQTHALQCQAEPDPAWSAYAAFAPAGS